jgi:hypothetical protein
MDRQMDINLVVVAGGWLGTAHRPKLKMLPATKKAGVTHLVTLLSEREGPGRSGRPLRLSTHRLPFGTGCVL